MQAAHQLVELGAVAGFGQHGAADVVLHVQVVVGHPDGVGQLEGHVDQLALEHRRQVHALGDVLAQAVEEFALVVQW